MPGCARRARDGVKGARERTEERDLTQRAQREEHRGHGEARTDDEEQSVSQRTLLMKTEMRSGGQPAADGAAVGVVGFAKGGAVMGRKKDAALKGRLYTRKKKRILRCARQRSAGSG